MEKNGSVVLCSMEDRKSCFEYVLNNIFNFELNMTSLAYFKLQLSFVVFLGPDLLVHILLWYGMGAMQALYWKEETKYFSVSAFS